MAFVATQRGHMQLVQIGEVWQIGVRFVAVIFTVLASPLRSHRLDALLVIVADINVLRTWIAAQLESLLCDRLLYPLAVAGVAGLIAASLHIVDQAACLVRVAASRVLLAGAESVVHGQFLAVVVAVVAITVTVVVVVVAIAGVALCEFGEGNAAGAYTIYNIFTNLNCALRKR